ncbi:MAG: zinc-dependent dehydrogenase [bacterium]
MKAARYYSNDDVRVEEVPVPEIGPGEILVEVKACGVCGSDVMEWYMKPRAPLFFGHEPAGVVCQVGKGVENLSLGDRVFVHHHVPCFVCHYCRRESYTMCRTFKETRLYPGGFADYIRVPPPNVRVDVLKLPAQVSFEEGSLIEPMACCLRGIKRANLKLGDTVLIMGAGFTGLIHLQLAKILGAGLVIVSDFLDFKLEKAKKLGADVIINPGKEEALEKIKEVNEARGADIVVVTPGNIEALKEAIRLAGKGATLYQFGPTSPEASLSIVPHQFFFSEITFVASYSCSSLETRTILEYISQKRIDTDGLITHNFSLDQIGQAVKLTAEAKESLKVLVKMGG